MRTNILKTIDNPNLFKQKLLSWAQQFREVVFLDNNNNTILYPDFDCVLAVDAFTSITTDYHSAFNELNQYQQHSKDWLFGYLTYDIKNSIYNKESKNSCGLDFPDLFFFQPKKLFFLRGNTLEIKYLNLCDDELELDFYNIENIKHSDINDLGHKNIDDIKQRILKDEYLNKVSKIKEYINRGDVYEINFCMEFYLEKTTIDPYTSFLQLNEISKAPFSAYFKNNNHFALSASPERYLKKIGEKVISQPIKGTAKRYEDEKLDNQSKIELSESKKEISENIMTVDLVRNDLSHTATKGSVYVEELCEIYTYNQVHQMISTITSEVAPSVSPIDIIKSTFPMGSMTGTPKISAMNIIEEQEETKRGLYSGAIGYFTPYGDLDFNVVIRTILFNNQNKYVSFSVGSAITTMSEPEQEYEECLLKAEAMKRALGFGVNIVS